MPGLLQVAQNELAASVRIAVPDYIGVRDPGFTSGVGILYNVIRNIRIRSTGNKKTVKNPKSTPAAQETAPKAGIWGSIKNIFKEFI
ncbi:Cell division protein FtsA [compost metagenome]